MIYLVGNAPDSTKYVKTDFNSFRLWIQGRTRYQLDVETNVTPFWVDKKLMTVQFGSSSSTENTQYVLQWSYLSDEQKAYVKDRLEDSTVLKLIQNALFEIVVLRFHGIEIENVYDTMLMEMVLSGGIGEEDAAELKGGGGESFSLKAIAFKRLGLTISKEEQTSFGDDILTERKVVYAAVDVDILHPIYIQQLDELNKEDLLWVAAEENEVVLSYAEMTYYGLELDKEMWRSNMKPAEDLVKGAEIKLNQWLTQEPFRSVALQLEYLSDQDRVLLSWSNANHRSLTLKYVFLDLEKATLPDVKKYAKARYSGKTLEEIEADPEEYYRATILEAFLKKDYTQLEQYVLTHRREDLIDKGLLIPADTVTINWNSVDQVLPLIKLVEPKIKSLSKEDLDKTSHAIVKDYKEYKDNTKLLSSYGETFISGKMVGTKFKEGFVEPDGKVRTTYNQVLTTGRVSSRRPNMQNIPAKETVGNRYRNCFMAPPGWKFVDSDYNSQELVVIAFLSKDPVWIKALENKEDLHSVCAELVYGERWKKAAEDTCYYYHAHHDKDEDKDYPDNSHRKCKCKQHKTMRTGVKTINFGLAYGMSEFKLAGTLSISVRDAKLLIKDYFKTFPAIERMLQILGQFGVRYGYSRTMAPFFRKRWYPYWELAKKFIPAHLKGIDYNSTLGSIERAAKNQPIQGSSADMIKLATIFIRWHIKEHNLQDKVHLAVQVHDQNTTVCVEDYAEEWKPVLTELMMSAGRVFIPTGLLRSETNVTDRWSK